MVRIFVDTNSDILGDIEDALDNAGINYDYDSGDRFMIDEADADMAVEIMEDCGADPEII